MEKIEGKNFEEARKKIKKARQNNQGVIFFSDNDELNRKILEKEKVDVLLLKQSKRKDFQKQRNSGLNHVLAKIAKKNNIEIGIDLDEIIASKKEEKAKILGRTEQNIKICNKHKIKMKFISEKYKRNLHDLKALGLILGMPTQMTKEIK